jgi:RTX calcium-binding nonapeptide repeat (4 copies)
MGIRRGRAKQHFGVVLLRAAERHQSVLFEIVRENVILVSLNVRREGGNPNGIRKPIWTQILSLIADIISPASAQHNCRGMSYKRNQIEEAIARIFAPNCEEPPSESRTRIRGKQVHGRELQRFPPTRLLCPLFRSWLRRSKSACAIHILQRYDAGLGGDFRCERWPCTGCYAREREHGAFYLGENVADSIAGRNGNDFLEGFGGNDTLTGAGGNDVLAGGGGNDWLDGGSGSDIALYDGNLSERQLVSFSGNVAVLNLAAGETDRLVAIETIQFDDTAVSTNSLPQFKGYDYLASYNDLIIAFGPNEMNAFDHYIYHGAFEGRQADAFDGYQYIASYGDLIEAFGANEQAGAQHFVSNGFAEGRARDEFDAAQYLANYPDLQAAYGTDESAATIHFITHGYFEGRTDDMLIV